MKEVVAASHANNEELKNQPPTGLFIINIAGELILQRKPFNHGGSTTYRWESPHLPLLPTHETAHHAAQQLLDTLGIRAELHEAFTGSSGSSSPRNAQHGRVIIALTTTEGTDTYRQTHTSSDCKPLALVVSDAHEHPQHYSPWLRTSLEGVELYLKNLLKQRTLHAHDQQSLAS